MNPKKLAEAYRTLSMGYAELADAYLDDASEVDAARVAPSFDELPPDSGEFEMLEREARVSEPQGSAAICPKHRVPYADGQYGPYCKQPTDDPAWGKQKGDRLWCRITPKNAADYLRVTAAA